MVTTLNFEKVGDTWMYKFVSEGAVVVEIERNSPSPVAITANLEGMDDVPVASFQNGYEANSIFEIDVPKGVEVTIKSTTEVTAAKMLA